MVIMDIQSRNSITRTELRAFMAALTVKRSAYSKPVRIYCDMDGVVQPLVSIDAMENPSDYVQMEVKVIPPNTGWADEVELVTTTFSYNKAIVERLSALSHSPLVDFVWHTSWRINAPLVMDAALNIKSVGFLDWQMKLGDHSHYFKTVAIEEEQAESPSPYIWIDDHANVTYNDENDEPPCKWVLDEEDEAEATPVEHLIVTPAGRTGLISDEMDLIESWVQEHAAVS